MKTQKKIVGPTRDSLRESALYMLYEFGFKDFDVRVTNAKSYVARIWPNRKLLRLSYPKFRGKSSDFGWGVILHEIAHIYHPTDGHRAAWHKTAKRIGCPSWAIRPDTKHAPK